MAESPAEPATFDDPFAWLLKPDAQVEEPGTKCEMSTCEARYDSKGERKVLNTGTTSTVEHVDDLPVPPASALKLIRVYDKLGRLQGTEMEVWSSHILKALREVAKSYSGVDFHAERVVISDFERLLFFYEDELREYGRQLTDSVAIKHLDLALQYLHKALKTEMRKFAIHVKASAEPVLDYENLWMIYTPGSLVYRKLPHCERLFRVKNPLNRGTMRLEEMRYNGTNFGLGTTPRSVTWFPGLTKIANLDYIPLKYHPQRVDIETRLKARGLKFVDLRGFHYCDYKGTAEVLSADRRTSILGEEDEWPLRTTHVSGRIVVHGERFASARPAHVPYLPGKELDPDEDEHLTMSDDDLMICDRQVFGYWLKEKKWACFGVEHVMPAVFNLDAFSQLLLDEEQKDIIQSLVKMHDGRDIGFEDVVRGKGKGLVLLLHGPPGTGKTLTAESVAEIAERPLFTMNAGDLDVKSSSLETSLMDAFDLATAWKAIVLIDEADVFLEERSLHDLERNSLVSVFLRLLEYYEGILILTTNRIKAFDTAFKSRIHFAISYPELSYDNRRELWRMFLTKVSKDGGLGSITEQYLDNLASRSFNGREIKNNVKTAHALALSKESELHISHIDAAVNAQAKFDAEFASQKNISAAQVEAPYMGQNSPNAQCEGGDRPKKRKRPDEDTRHDA